MKYFFPGDFFIVSGEQFILKQIRRGKIGFKIVSGETFNWKTVTEHRERGMPLYIGLLASVYI